MPSKERVWNRTTRVAGRIRAFDLGDIPHAHIMCAGDLHIGDANMDTGMIHGMVEWVMGQDDRYLILAGDVLNMATRASVSFQYGDMSPRAARELTTEILSPLAGTDKVLCVIDGNHDFRADKEIGISALEWVCQELGMPYFGSEALIRLRIGHWAHKTRKEISPVSYVGYVAHGVRGGRLPGNKLNGLMDYRKIVPNADFFVGGHGHDPVVKPDGTFMVSPTHALVYQDQFFISCGASLDRKIGEGYASRFIFPPLAKVFPILSISGSRKKMIARTGDDDEL